MVNGFLFSFLVIVFYIWYFFNVIYSKGCKDFLLKCGKNILLDIRFNIFFLFIMVVNDFLVKFLL